MAGAAALLVRANFAKAARHPGVWVVVTASVLFSCWVQWHSGATQEGWIQALSSARSALQEIRHGQGCAILSGPGQHCSPALVAQLRTSAVSEVSQATNYLRWGGAGLTPPGAVIVSLGLLATGVGFVLGVAVGAVAIEMETRSGGLKSTLLTGARRRDVVLATAAGGYLCVALGSICVIGGVVGISAVQSAIRPLGVGAGALTGTGLPSVWLLILGAALTPAVGLGVALCAGLGGRSSLAALGGVTGLVIIDRVISTMASAAAPYTMVGSIGRLTSALGQSRLASAGVTVSLWPTGALRGAPGWALPELALITGCALYIAVISLRYREVR